MTAPRARSAITTACTLAAALVLAALPLVALAQGGPQGGVEGGTEAAPSQLATWAILAVVVIAVGIGTRRVGDWVRTRLDPTLDQVQHAASLAQLSSEGGGLRPWRAPATAAAPLALGGLGVLVPGKANLLLAEKRHHAAELAARLLMHPTAAVALLAQRDPDAAIAASLDQQGTAHAAVGPRLWISTAADTRKDGLGVVMHTIAGRGHPAATILELGTDEHDVLGAVRQAARLAGPILDEGGGALLIVVALGAVNDELRTAAGTLSGVHLLQRVHASAGAEASA